MDMFLSCNLDCGKTHNKERLSSFVQVCLRETSKTLENPGTFEWFLHIAIVSLPKLGLDEIVDTPHDGTGNQTYGTE